MYLIADFREKDTVAAAIQALRGGGIDPADLDVFSEEPMEFPRGVLDRGSRMSLASVSGAILCGSLATAFIWWAQHDYNLVTGGMPTFSLWATGVITFEMTMLGAIVATFAWFLKESGLFRKRDRSAPVPELGPGAICLRVRCGEDAVSTATDTLRKAGAGVVEQRGNA